MVGDGRHVLKLPTAFITWGLLNVLDGHYSMFFQNVVCQSIFCHYFFFFTVFKLYYVPLPTYMTVNDTFIKACYI